jgi:hypothetical protein
MKIEMRAYNIIHLEEALETACRDCRQHIQDPGASNECFIRYQNKLTGFEGTLNKIKSQFDAQVIHGVPIHKIELNAGEIVLAEDALEHSMSDFCEQYRDPNSTQSKTFLEYCFTIDEKTLDILRSALTALFHAA